MSCLLAGCASIKSVTPPSEEHEPTTRREVISQPKLSDMDALRFSELYHAAVVARVGQNFDAAFELFHEAARVNPYSAETFYELAALYQDVAGQDSSYLFSLSDSLLQRSISLSPDNIYYKIALIENYIKQGRYEESIPYAREVAIARPTAENYLRLENLCEMGDDYEGALFALSHLERIDGKSLENSLYQFRAYQQLGREAEGFRVMEDLCRAYPSELRYRVKMGDLYFTGGHEEMAIRTYHDVLTMDPDNDAAQFAMLDYYLQKGDSLHFNALLPTYLLNTRADDYEKELLLDGFIFDNGIDNPLVWTLFDKLLFQDQPDPLLVRYCAEYLGEGTEALAVLSPYYYRILEINPEYDRVRLQALQLAISQNQNEQILKLCVEGHAYNPTSAIYYFIEANTLIQEDRIEEALVALDNGTQYASDHSDPYIISLLYSTQGQLLVDMGEMNEGFAAYDSALVYDKNNPELLYEYATLLALQSEKLDKSEDMIKQALTLEADNPLYLATYAYVLYSLEKIEKAKDTIDRALHLAKEQPDWGQNPDYGRILDHAGDIYFDIGQAAEAVTYWKQAIAQTDDPDLQQNIEQKIVQGERKVK